MSRSALKGIQAAAGAGGGVLYVEDVFSTFLYEGTGSNQTITNNIDLSGEGGLIWSKRRDSTARSHILVDSVRGATKVLNSDGTYAEYTMSNMPSSFNSNGYTIGTSDAGVNNSGDSYASWTFRKAPKFFDIVTYTGDGNGNRSISHNLDATPGFVIIKRTDATSKWACWVRNSDGSRAITALDLSSNSASGVVFSDYWMTGMTSTAINLNYVADTGSGNSHNVSGGTYVAYIFAHHNSDGDYGENSDQDIIKCGTYTGTGSYSSPPVIDLGFEPQWVMIKNATSAGDWLIGDVMRGATSQIIGSAGEAKILKPNSSNAEASYSGGYIPISPTATGFTMSIDGSEGNASGNTYIYMAIRRPNKPASEFAATDLFAIDTYGSTGDGAEPGFRSTLPIDMAIRADTGVASNEISSRLTQGKWMYTNLTNAEASQSLAQFDYQNGWFAATGTASNYYSWMFRRAPGFFDVVAYTGTGSNRTINHNLGVAPEMMIIKARESLSPYVAGWVVYHSAISPANSIYLNLNGSTSGASFQFASTAPTNSVFTLGSAVDVNMSGKDFISYHFASVNGISKVGSYTGTGSDVNVDCGFSAGARFVLIKRTDSNADWYVWDSARGIVAGNDPYLRLNSSSEEITNTDYIDPLSSGFTVPGSISPELNASGGNYIFLAIA
jgi:hypothetical protein